MITVIAAALVVGCVAGLASRRLIEIETDAPIRLWVPVLATGLLSAAVAWRLDWSWSLPAYLYFAAISVPLAVIDLRTHRLPNQLTLTAYPALAVLLLLPALVDGQWTDLGRAGLGAAALLVFFALLHVINPAGMGLGDVKLAGPMGGILGWGSWTAVFAGTLVGFLLGAVVGLALMALKRANRKTALPFGPFMLVGAWAAILMVPWPI